MAQICICPLGERPDRLNPDDILPGPSRELCFWKSRQPATHPTRLTKITPLPVSYEIVTDTLPLATVQKIVTEILPPSSGLAFGKDARDLLIECCVEFITLISSEANEISEKENKKTIACEHITKALEQLGFSEYVNDIMDVANEHKEAIKVCIPPYFFSFFLLLLPLLMRVLG
jgi:histone H3/H4